MTALTSREIVRLASDKAFNRCLVSNIHRGHLVEAMIAIALEPEWRWCSQDWYAWDFENEAICRLEVKQSALRQSWSNDSTRPRRPTFDIAARQFRWEGSTRIDESGRFAQIYVFAFHGVDDATADHREPGQWSFYVVGTDRLPDNKTISLSVVAKLAEPCSLGELKAVVARERNVQARMAPAP